MPHHIIETTDGAWIVRYADGKEVIVLHPEHSYRADPLLFAADADGRVFITLRQMHDAHYFLDIWSLDRQRWLGQMGTLAGRVSAVALSSDARVALSASVRRRGEAYQWIIEVWEVATRRRLFELTGHTDRIVTLAFLPGNRQFLSASEDGTLRLWDLDTGSERGRLDARTSEITSLHVDGETGRAVTMGRDGHVRLWDVRAWRPITSFTIGSLVTAGSVDWQNGCIACGDQAGQMHFLRIE